MKTAFTQKDFKSWQTLQGFIAGHLVAVEKGDIIWAVSAKIKAQKFFEKLSADQRGKFSTALTAEHNAVLSHI